jgi:hypothetical protein
MHTSRPSTPRFAALAALATLAASLSACGGASMPAAPVYSAGTAAPSPAATAPAADSTRSALATGDTAAAQPTATTATTTAAPAPVARPGLATEFGEVRRSTQRTLAFQRAANAPVETLTIRYNHPEGIAAQVHNRHARRAEFIGAYRDGLRISVRDERGHPLPAHMVAETLYVAGEQGQRYELRIENLTEHTFESLITVDGINTLNAQPYAPGHQGFIIPPHSHWTVSGFRLDAESVADFRFGSPANSAAAAAGTARSIGVIGVMVYPESGAVPPGFGDTTAARTQAAARPSR